MELAQVRKLVSVVVNLSDSPAQAQVHLGWPQLAGRAWQLIDALADAVYDRSGEELLSAGL